MMNKIKEQAEFLVVNAVAMQSTGVGDYVYRVEQPSIALGKVPGVMVVNVSTISPYFSSLCLRADLLVLHLLTEHDILPIIEQRKQTGKPTVYEVSDNFVALETEQEVKGWFSDPVNSALCFQYIQLADAIQVTGEGLGDYYGFLNENVVILENHISEMGRPPRYHADIITIGWGGSAGHAGDLRYISEVVAGLCRKYANLRFAYMGNDDQFVEIFASVPDHQKLYTQPGSLADYFVFLEKLDIGIAPMLNTPYNQCRSDVKFLEYASRGVAPVLSRVRPYLVHAEHGVNALLFDDPLQFSVALERLILDQELRHRIAENAYEYVKQQRLEDQNSQARVDFYKSLGRGPVSSVDFNMPELVPLAQGTKAYDVKKTEAEKILYKGVMAEADSKLVKARRLYGEAARQMPGYYLPYFWQGYSHMRHGESVAAQENFKKALECNPDSLRTMLYLGNVLKEVSRDQALQVFEQALGVSSAYAPVIEAVSLLFEEDGDYETAVKFYDSALATNPFSSNAALGLARAFLGLGEGDRALKALQVAADIAPNSVEPLYRLAEYFWSTGDSALCSKYCVKALELEPGNAMTLKLVEKVMAANGKDV